MTLSHTLNKGEKNEEKPFLITSFLHKVFHFMREKLIKVNFEKKNLLIRRK